jgi:hypothetical protein
MLESMMKLMARLLVLASLLAAASAPALADGQWYDTSKRPDLWRS